MTTKEAKESILETQVNASPAILEAQVNAALSGHDIGSFEPVDNGYQAACRRCGKMVWVAESGLMYSLLGDACKGEGRTT